MKKMNKLVMCKLVGKPERYDTVYIGTEYISAIYTHHAEREESEYIVRIGEDRAEYIDKDSFVRIMDVMG